MSDQLLLPGTAEGFRTILADPPWEERGGGKCVRGAQRHYPVLNVHEIRRVMARSPLWLPHRDGCHLWMWATSNHLPDAFWLIEALGFRYVTSAEWVKLQRKLPEHWPPDVCELAALSLQRGLGQYMRHGHEHLLLATSGSLPVPPPERRPPSVIFAPRGRHSEKPVEQYVHIEAVSPGSYLEMFARAQRRPGWKIWGNEVTND